MQISFLLGPAGSGKTFRCLNDIRTELAARPEGPALVFLAPKQSTFQLERQLLELAPLQGYSRLRILSFERLARFIIAELKAPLPSFLSDQGRTMVCRALLTRWADELNVFRAAARRTGFADELSSQIREFQNHGLSPAGVRALAGSLAPGFRTAQKLADLALLYEKYLDWLKAQSLQDSDALLDSAADLLTPNAPFQLGGLWFDGFAQLTPQELRLLTSVLRFTPRATLAFCVENEKEDLPSVSPWHLVSHTFQRCRAAIAHEHGEASVHLEVLPRDPRKSRFSACEALAHLERCWSSPVGNPVAQDAVKIVQATDAEEEATFAAREILKFVRAGGRFREAAVLLRSFQNEHLHTLRRVFRRYEVPVFLDHRENVAHHPVAELTRGALRTLAYNWKHEDWFATIKCGLIDQHRDAICKLENEALARGWEGDVWRNGLSIPQDPSLEASVNKLRIELIAPFQILDRVIGSRPSAEELVDGIRVLWKELRIEDQLKSWSREDPAAVVHLTVWEQLNTWLDDLLLAFRGHRMPISGWLPILDAGLMNLTVGVVPPVLDQVLIGAVDRSRNPDLKIAFVLGLNERLFPAVPARDSLLSEDDRDALLTAGCTMGHVPALRMAAEQFYGYIACTRPREKLWLTFSRMDAEGKHLNESRFVAQVKRLFPALTVEQYSAPATLDDIVHPCEFTALGVSLPTLPERNRLYSPRQDEQLDPALAHRLYGDELSIAVSSLERFASCPFQFYVRHGLGVRERDEFSLDVRQQGSFQHEVLAKFHEELMAEGLRWRDLTPNQARERIGRIADALAITFKGGLLAATEQNRFTAETYKRSLQNFIAVIIGWFATNHFDPEQVEFGFGDRSDLPGLRIPLKDGRALVLHGRVDRVDLYRKSASEAACIIIDYKSGADRPDKVLLHHGIQQQMPGYLLAMTRVRDIADHFKLKSLTPGGCFLLPLSGSIERGKSRREALEDVDDLRRAAYTHGGIYDLELLSALDSGAPAQKSGQFEFRLKKSGEPYSNTFNALTADRFQAILTRSETLMRETGERLYAGDISIFPYRKGAKKTACGRCKFQPICRFDPWVQKYNVLLATEPAESEEAETSQFTEGAASRKTRTAQ